MDIKFLEETSELYYMQKTRSLLKEGYKILGFSTCLNGNKEVQYNVIFSKED